MPLLPLERFVFPDQLLDSPEYTSTDGRCWWVLHTRPRAEKSLARRVIQRHVPFFLPLYHRRWRQRGRQFDSYVPLFPGYLFLLGDFEARLAALASNLVARTLVVDDQHQLHRDLFHVHQLMMTGVPLTPEERLLPGTAVEISAGPLAGLTGKVLKRAKTWRVTVEVQFLQRGVSAEMEDWMVKPLRA
jgi:transcriptional antiterminator RfaH